jgi:hypothetical protein
MKKRINSVMTGVLMTLLLMYPTLSRGQSEKEVINRYLKKLPVNPVGDKLQKYRMTAVYTNRDLYGAFTGKTKVTGDYTRGLGNGLVKWNNVWISNSDKFSEPFPTGTKQDYIENFEYIPSPKMLEAGSFKNFPPNPETVFSRNLVWDMQALEGFAWKYADSLQLNKTFRIREITGEFAMADIGTYSHTGIQLTWTGISAFNGELCAVIEFRALDNKLEMAFEGLKTRGTEQYWGTVWVSLKTREIEQAEMYSGTMQEIEVPGLENKFLVKTIRELSVEKIQ